MTTLVDVAGAAGTARLLNIGKVEVSTSSIVVGAGQEKEMPAGYPLSLTTSITFSV
jgi:hypothetical protein